MIYIAYTLTMPKVGSWDGKWTGGDKQYIQIRRYPKNHRYLINILSSGSYCYDFEDGWVAKITVEQVTPEIKRIKERESAGFCGYDWMIASIEEYGEILTQY